MVQYFEDLAKDSVNNGISLRVCFSSRHYPYVDIRQGIRITLENQAGHVKDLARYTRSRLRIMDQALFDDLQYEILEKAGGVFLWVVLVVEILNDEDRHGRPSLRKRLAELPPALSELFKHILKREDGEMSDSLLCILWILFATRPLRPDEFYHAVWFGQPSRNLTDSEVLECNHVATYDRIERYVISSSKGLAEIIRQEKPVVQFIHESVRDFLIKDQGLRILWPELDLDFERPSHEKLKLCCLSYINHKLARASLNELPFLEYASQNILYHANIAATAIPQNEFLSQFPVQKWISINDLYDRYQRYQHSASLFYILAEIGFAELIRARVKDDTHVHVLGGIYRYPLFVASANGNIDAIAALLNLSFRIRHKINDRESLNFKIQREDYECRTPLSWAAKSGNTGIVKLLLQTDVAVNEIDMAGRGALSLASESGYEGIIELLLEKGADGNIRDKDGMTALLWAAKKCYAGIIELILKKGADIDTCDTDRMTSLSWA